MKYRTFTVLFVEEYDPANGVEMTDEEARKEVRDTLQDCYDNYHAPGTNFLIVDVEDGDQRFWDEWKARSATPENDEAMAEEAERTLDRDVAP